jgi:type I restriction-modification system DNA methylase subunit
LNGSFSANRFLDRTRGARLNAAVPDLRQKLSALLDRYNRDKDQVHTEADVSANFVDQLFAALGWDIFSALEYNRQRYVREAGYADVGLLIAGEPKLFVEVKRFGLIPKSSERRGDRTPEEKQAFKYARQEKIRWAVLTNFERLHVFDADQERLILAFDDPQEYVQRIEELNRLARANMEHKSLEHFASLQAKEDIDRHFLENLMRWRKLLAQDILDRNANNDAILTAGKPDLDKLRRVVQRILDRLVIIRFADDRELLDDFGVMEGMLAGFQSRRRYTAEGQLYHDFLGFCAGMDRKHNTEIFSPKHPCEQVAVGNDCLEKILDEITTISFRKFTSDILGNTYESYLGHRLELKDGRIGLAERRDLRKGAGIYYTPPYVVRYIVDQTLGKKLEELEARHGLAAAHEARKLKVLDPACGSGSFLIYAFDVLAAFYERCNQRITAGKVRLLKDHEFGDVLGTQDKIKTLPPLLLSYPKIILEENLYGVDLDEEAAELAGVNLIMKAFDRVSSNGRKLPLILNQNIKVGNSLIGYLPGAKLWEKTSIAAKDAEKIIALRQRIRSTEDDTAKRRLLEDAEQQTRLVTEPLNVPLKEFFADPAAKRPFHWPEEFPEVFARENPGFDIVIGNPPYMLLQPQNVDVESLGFYKKFPVAQFKLDIYHLFVNRGIDLLADGAYFAYITPAPFLMNNYTVKLRGYILDTCSVQQLVVIPDGVFPDASVDNVIFVCLRTKGKSDRARSVIRYTIVPAYAVPEKGAWSAMKQAQVAKTKDYLFVLAASDVIEPKAETVFLKDIATVNFGMQLRDRQKFKSDVVETDNPAGLSKFHEPCWDGGSVSRYNLRFENFYAYVNEEAREGGCWDMSVHHAEEKIIVRQIGDRPICAFDDSRRVCLNTVFMIVPRAQYSAKFILAILNSHFMAHFWQQHYSDYKRTFPKIKGTYLLELPIPKIEFEKRLERSKYDALEEVADRMVRLHRQKAAAEQSFADGLNNHPHDWKSLGNTYWNRPEYVSLMGKKAHVKAGDTAEITALRCELDGQTIQISAKAAADWTFVLDMAVADDKLRFFIFYGIRQFLRDNARKRKWGEGKLLQTVLEKIQVPVFFSHGVYDHETHLKTLKLVLAEMKKKSPLHNLTGLERDIATTDDEIEKRVFALYGLSDKEIKLVRES